MLCVDCRYKYKDVLLLFLKDFIVLSFCAPICPLFLLCLALSRYLKCDTRSSLKAGKPADGRHGRLMTGDDGIPRRGREAPCAKLWKHFEAASSLAPSPPNNPSLFTLYAFYPRLHLRVTTIVLQQGSI